MRFYGTSNTIRPISFDKIDLSPQNDASEAIASFGQNVESNYSLPKIAAKNIAKFLTLATVIGSRTLFVLHHDAWLQVETRLQIDENCARVVCHKMTNLVVLLNCCYIIV